MKKILLFFALIFLFGCESLLNETNETLDISCPSIYFSEENSSYVDGDLSEMNLDKVNFKASLNNYLVQTPCFSDAYSNNYTVNLLILVEPLNPEEEDIKLPIFGILYDSQDNIVDKQFFRINSYFNYNDETSNYELKEVIINLEFLVQKDYEVNSITIGFVKI